MDDRAAYHAICTTLAASALEGISYSWFRQVTTPEIGSPNIPCSHGKNSKCLHRNLKFLPCEQGDRKSTRLNSSHGYISYAVFCLKKKKLRYIIFRDTAEEP